MGAWSASASELDRRGTRDVERARFLVAWSRRVARVRLARARWRFDERDDWPSRDVGRDRDAQVSL